MRELNLDGVDLLISANIDGTVRSIAVVHTTDDTARMKALADARKLFGAPQPDLRTQTQPTKWGVVRLTDMCGRPTSAPQ